MTQTLAPSGPDTSSDLAISGMASAQLDAFPKTARLINLRPDSKFPASIHGHHDALPANEFVQMGTNVGIVLDGMFILADFDRLDNAQAQELCARLETETPTWEQQTPHGKHFLFRVPNTWKGTNAKLCDAQGVTYGDLKALGYAVGPGSIVGGSTYKVVKNREPAEAPQWLLGLAARPERAKDTKVEEREGIPYGDHDRFLTSLAGYLRGKEGLTEKAILGFLAAGALGVLADYDETRPYTDRDLARIARSASRWEPARAEDGLDSVHPSLRSATTIELVGPTIEWVVRGFVPRGELVLMYGPGGIGKSSAGSWLASECSRQGLQFCYMGTEEPPARFFGRSILAGADRTKCFDVVNPSALKLPRDAKVIRDMIVESKVDFLYIDSIYSHFERKEGDNAAERARDSLAPLLAIAHETGCTIFGVFHTNKAGAFLGSTEMENVARCLLEAKRKPKQEYLGIRVHKTNLYNPGKMMRLEGHEEIFRDEQGTVQLERDENGNENPLKIIVPVRIADVDDDPDQEDFSDAPMQMDPDDIRDFKLPQEPMIDRLRKLMEEQPELKYAEYAEILEVSKGYLSKLASKINNELLL